ncbi:hypothetical protein EON79_00815 [bacterium]|nr:MAG: hypothetical protein EON79_00815 [bacterium]
MPVLEALAALDETSRGAPLLALGQTVFWDEPMKAGLALQLRRSGSDRRLVAGVHDTDYFAKLSGGRRQRGEFRAVPHNDGSTRGLWSAAAEFSALFGSETVPTRESLVRYGVRLDRLEADRPGYLDEATEAWGWRGIVSLDDAPPITAETPLKRLFPLLHDTLEWAMGRTVDAIEGRAKEDARQAANRLCEILCETDAEHLGDLYRRILPDVYSFVAGRPVDLDAATTSELLRFNTETCLQPRFDLFDLFVADATRATAKRAYDEAIVTGSGQYELARFGTGAIPFDLVVPGYGRGTIRIGNRAVVINTPKPLFISLKKPLSGVSELAELIERRFGKEVVVVGKAVSLLGMLAREFVFVFHDGASGYSSVSATFHRKLAEAGLPLKLNPILRVRYSPWDALTVACTWLRLPEPMRRAFGADEICAPSFATRWRDVAAQQATLLSELRRLRRPVELIDFLDSKLGGSWRRQKDEYAHLHESLKDLQGQLEVLTQRRKALYDEAAHLKAARQETERASGEHWRAELFDREPTSAALERRAELQDAVARVVEAQERVRHKRRDLARERRALVESEPVLRVHERRRVIELEAELMRARLVREAIMVSQGLPKAAHRPSAWWFPLVSPDGLWFRETVETAEAWLEPLI